MVIIGITILHLCCVGQLHNSKKEPSDSKNICKHGKIVVLSTSWLISINAHVNETVLREIGDTLEITDIEFINKFIDLLEDEKVVYNDNLEEDIKMHCTLYCGAKKRNIVCFTIKNMVVDGVTYEIDKKLLNLLLKKYPEKYTDTVYKLIE